MLTIKEIREHYHISRQKLAKSAGVGMSTLDRIENSQHLTMPEVAEKILEALSKETGQNFTLENVSGLNLYDAMRDRRRGKSKEQQS